jgi:hypothetical protein
MTVIRDFYCHDFTFFNNYPEESRVLSVRMAEAGGENLVMVWGKDKDKAPFLLARGYIPLNVLLTVCEKELC